MGSEQRRLNSPQNTHPHFSRQNYLPIHMVPRHTNFGSPFATTLFFDFSHGIFFLTPNFPPFWGPTAGPNSYITLEFGPGDIAPLLSSVQRSGGLWAKGGRVPPWKKYLSRDTYVVAKGTFTTTKLVWLVRLENFLIWEMFHCIHSYTHVHRYRRWHWQGESHLSLQVTSFTCEKTGVTNCCLITVLVLWPVHNTFPLTP